MAHRRYRPENDSHLVYSSEWVDDIDDDFGDDVESPSDYNPWINPERATVEQMHRAIGTTI